MNPQIRTMRFSQTGPYPQCLNYLWPEELPIIHAEMGLDPGNSPVLHSAFRILMRDADAIVSGIGRLNLEPFIDGVFA